MSARSKAKHAAPSPVRRTLAVGGVAAAFAVAHGAPAGAFAAVPASAVPSAASAGTTHVAATTHEVRRLRTPVKASRNRVSAPRTAPVLERTISLADRRSYRLVVAQWQARMAQRGWRITVDGVFGPQSASVARRFAAEKGLRLPAAATVDRALYTAAWTAPVT